MQTYVALCTKAALIWQQHHLRHHLGQSLVQETQQQAAQHQLQVPNALQVHNNRHLRMVNMVQAQISKEFHAQDVHPPCGW
jgi:hypothetical protein